MGSEAQYSPLVGPWCLLSKARLWRQDSSRPASYSLKHVFVVVVVVVWLFFKLGGGVPLNQVANWSEIMDPNRQSIKYP